MGPLARLSAIKLKLGALLVGGVAVTTGVLLLASAWGLHPVVALAAAAIVALGTIEVLGSGLTGPLRQMAEQADRLADGRPVAPVDESARDEVGALARAFNRMAREVAHTDRLRRELVANVSHELRTPLAAMTAVVENLVDGVEQPTSASLGRLEQQTQRLAVLVDQLLDLSQLDAGAVHLDRTPTATAALVADAVATCGPDASTRVVVEVADAASTVDVDPSRFVQVLVNLIGNALRHGPAATPVVVTADRVGDEIALVVADEGPGIAPRDERTVFERFARTDDGRASATGGAGLGLPITRWLVELHGGRIAVDHHGGVGARMRVTVPASPTTTDLIVHHTEEDTMSAIDRTAVPPPPPGSADVSASLLPTPVAGLGPRALVAVAVAAVVASLLGPQLLDAPGLGMTVLLGVAGGAVLVAAERRLDRFGRLAVGLALVMVACWAWTDALWVLVPGTLVAAVLAGLGLWGPHRAGEVLRALVVGPMLVLASPVALVRGARSQEPSQVRRMVVPGVATVLVLLVFGGLLAQGDAAFGAAVDAIAPDVSWDLGSIVGRVLFGGFVALAVTTYVLVQRAGTIETAPWARPVRPRTDWLVPVVALDVLLGLAIVLRLGVLFGGEERVLATTGLTYAEYARSGFGSLIALAALALAVVAVVVELAADDDRRVRDRVLGVLLAATGVVVVSAAQRLWLYVDQFGLTRLRFSAAVAIATIAVLLALVAAAGRSTAVATALPRSLVLLVGVVTVAVALVRPDALIGAQQLARAQAGEPVDGWYLTSLSADAVPSVLAIYELPDAEIVDRPELPSDLSVCPGAGSTPWTGWNAARARLDADGLALVRCGSADGD